MAKPQALIQAGGIRALSRSIRIVVDKELGDEMRAASRAAAEKIVPYAKKAVPVGATGRLKASIKAEATRSRAIIKAGTAAKTPYAMAVHRGHYMKASGKRTRATPFLSSVIPKAWPEMVDEAMDKRQDRQKFNKKHGVSRVYGRFGSGGK